MTDPNQVFNDNYDYIKAGAEVAAKDIVRKTRSQMYEKDFAQELMFAVFHKAHLYEASRGKPKTFITMVIGSTRKNILHRLTHKSSDRVAFLSAPLDPGLIDGTTPDMNILMAVEEMPEEARLLWEKAMEQGFSSLAPPEQEKLKTALTAAGLSPDGF